MASPTQAMRNAWADYDGNEGAMHRISFGPDSILVAPPTIEAWGALERVLEAFNYDIRIGDTDSYNDRQIKGGGGKSLHAYGIALDVNWQTNPFKDHAGKRAERFSSKPTQAERAEDVRVGIADTDMTRQMTDAVLAIKTMGGRRVFGWGGAWETLKDSMHFQIEVTPTELAKGIDWTTVQGGGPPDHFGTVLPPGSYTSSENGSFAATSAGAKGVDMGFSRKVFYDAIRTSPTFGGSLSQSAVDNIDIILDYWFSNFATHPINQLAYILATVRHEVGSRMAPVRETFAASDAEARNNLSGKPYAKSAGPFGHAYYGRGYVQLTWLKNYQRQQDKLGIGFVQNPDLVLDSRHAIRILVEGMMDGDFNGAGHGLGFYVNENRQDFVQARRTVNVLDNATAIAQTAERFLAALDQATSDLFADPIIKPSEEHKMTKPGIGISVGSSDDRLRDVLEQLAIAVGTMKSGSLQNLPDLDPRTRDLLNVILTARGDPAKIKAALDAAGQVLDPPQLTQVNNAFGQTIGKLLDGRKTAIGMLGTLATFLLGGGTGDPVLGPSNAGAILGPVLQAVGGSSPYILPITIALTLWGVLGKVDKWVKKPGEQ